MPLGFRTVRLTITRSAPILAVLATAGTAVAQDFDEQTSSRFPSNSSLYTNQATVGDIDNDGDLDIIWANGGNFSSPGANQVTRVYINDGTANFTDESAARLGFSGLCRGAEMGDIDADGDLDLILAQDFNRQPQLFTNDGSGNFTNATANLPAMTLSSSRAQFGDVDNDGDLDIYITSGSTSRFTCGQYRVYINDGTGMFVDETATRHPIGNVCNNMDCIFGDLDGDFDLDVRTASTGTNNSRLYENDGTGVYSTVNGVPSDSTCYSYDMGDINGDGDLDMIGVNAGPGSTELLLSNSGGMSFLNVSNRIMPNPSQDDNDSKFFDYDNDGDLDLIVGRLGSGGEKLYNNNGTGLFNQVTGVVQVISDSTLDIVVADFDNDGDYDFITAQGESGSFVNRIYINTEGPADTIAPTIIDTEQLADTKDTDGPYVVRTAILDGMTSDRNFFDKGITLHYTVDGGKEMTVDMVHSGGQIYRGEIPGVASGVVEYWVSAIDWNDNEGTGDAKMFTVTGVAIPGDIDMDGDVDVADLLLMLAAWGPCPGCPEDVNMDDEVDTVDLLILLANWT